MRSEDLAAAKMSMLVELRDMGADYVCVLQRFSETPVPVILT
jgi:hypothetical protein